MYTRKPKDLTKFLNNNLTVGQASHTWQYEDKKRLAQIGSSALLSSTARQRRELNRKVIGEYRTSQIATVATRTKGDVVQFTHNERQKREARFGTGLPDAAAVTTSLPERPKPDASLYRRPSI